MASKKSQTVTLNKLNDYISHVLSKGASDLIQTAATNVSIQKLSKIHGGIHSTYRFSIDFCLNGENTRLKLILKFYTDEEIAKREYLTLRTLEHVKFPVPHAYILETEEKTLGAPFVIMEEVEGEKMGDYVKHLSKDETINFFDRFAETLVSLHELKIEELNVEFLEAPKDEYEYAKKQALEDEERLLNRAKSQNLGWVINWIEKNAPKYPCHQYSLLHGDMNPNNFLVNKNGRITFLDWTWTEIGDPLKDVGWAYHSIRHMFGMRKIDKKGAEIASRFLKQYIRKSSRNIDHFSLQFYLASAGLRNASFFEAQSENMKNPLSAMKVFGAKFLPASPFIYWHFRSRSKHLKTFLKKTVFDYEKKMFGTPGGTILSKNELQDILRFLKPSPSDLILDIGTGSSRITREIITNSKARVIGIDIARGAAKSAKARTQNLSGYEVLVADGGHLPFREDSFDGIVCIRALKYFPNYVLGLSEMSRTLKPNKRLVFDISSVLGYEFFLRYITHSLSSRGAHVFTLYSMKSQLESQKFAIVNSVPLQKIPHRLWTMFRSPTILKFLLICENKLKKITPLVLSRSILLECIKKSDDS